MSKHQDELWRRFLMDFGNNLSDIGHRMFCKGYEGSHFELEIAADIPEEERSLRQEEHLASLNTEGAA